MWREPAQCAVLLLEPLFHLQAAACEDLQYFVLVVSEDVVDPVDDAELPLPEFGPDTELLQ